MMLGGAADGCLQWRVRVAAEDGPGGEYVVIAESAELRIAAPIHPHSTLTIAAAGKTLMHAPADACVFGLNESKVMIVPKNRGVVHLCEFIDSSAAHACLDALHRMHADVTVQKAHTPSDEEAIDHELSVLSSAPEFCNLVAQYEAALERTTAKLPLRRSLLPGAVDAEAPARVRREMKKLS